jgi:MoxR-like ATPase
MSTPTLAINDSAELKERIERFQEVQRGIVREVRKVIVGQDEVIEQVMISLFVGGHCLITGLPGTAKTLLVRTLAQTLGLVFKRIQFTPDLMPSDITGTDIIEEDPTTGRRTWTFVAGPIFSNILLADEINRTPPKTQSALLEAMQELSCTVRGHQYKSRRRSSSWRRKTRSSSKAPIRYPKRSWIASCSTPCSTIFPPRTK